MDGWTLENSRWRVRVAAQGAELCEWWDKTRRSNRLWQPQAGVWNSSATQLFPVVGRLVHNGLRHQGAFWPLPAHGFLRHQRFHLVEQSSVSLRLACEDSDDTRQIWPFRWRVTLCWTLAERGLEVSWQVENLDARRLPFALGWHPGFALPVASEPGWQVRFSAPVAGPFPTEERTLRLPPSPAQSTVFPLDNNAFAAGAVYFATPGGVEVNVLSPTGRVTLRLHSPDTEWLALWGVPGADLLCIEPLTSTTDDPDFDGEVAFKRGMRWLAPGELYQQAVSVILAQDAEEIDG